MSVSATRKLAEIASQSATDPVGSLRAAIGEKNIAQFEPFHNLVLVGQYVRPEKTKGGIIIGGDRTRAEDRFQGKLGLVLKCGPMAFKDDQISKFGGIELKENDWVMFRPSDAIEFFLVDRERPTEGTSVRLIEDVHIKARVKDPQWVF